MHFYKKIKVAEVKIETKQLKIGDRLMIQGPTTGVHEQKLTSMEIKHKRIKEAGKGKVVAVKLEKTARKNDKAYIIIK